MPLIINMTPRGDIVPKAKIKWNKPAIHHYNMMLRESLRLQVRANKLRERALIGLIKEGAIKP